MDNKIILREINKEKITRMMNNDLKNSLSDHLYKLVQHFSVACFTLGFYYCKKLKKEKEE